MKYIIYDNNSGEVYAIYEGAHPELQVNRSQNFIQGEADYFTEYIDVSLSPPKIAPRPSNPTAIDKTTILADGIDKAILTNVPLNSVVTLTDANNNVTTDTATSATIDLIFDIVGTYKLKVELFPYLPFEATINAN